MGNYSNPLDLKIGYSVIVSASSWLGYDEDGNKILTKNVFSSPRKLYVVRSVKKALGKYVAGHYYGDGESDGAYLNVSKYVWLYECSEAIDKQPFLVQPEDIQPV